MEDMLASDIDDIIKIATEQFTKGQLLQHECEDTKVELNTLQKLNETLKLSLEMKNREISTLLSEKLSSSKILTQSAYTSGNAIQSTETMSKLGYELDIAKSTIKVLQRDIQVLRTENERLKRNSDLKRKKIQYETYNPNQNKQK